MTTEIKEQEHEQEIEIPDFLTVRELADLMEVSPINVIKELMTNGIMANINQQIDFDTAAIVAEEFGFVIASRSQLEEDEEELELSEQPVWRQILAEEADVDLQARPVVITMLGHVDHGKTSLLDVIRETKVQAGEAGGITQHIGAYQIAYDDQPITFLDTPGHEAFTAMRARGAQATDIAILVIAADDGIMPQTREAVDHARAARVPIVVALNKIDLPNANPERVKQQLAELGLVPDEWDGDTLVIPVSAKERYGIDELLEAILIVAEDLEPRANPATSATGTILEARKERGRGIMATVLVQNGTLRLGDTLLVSQYYGRIKAMFDYKGMAIESAGPSVPASVAGLNGMPTAGEQFTIVESEKVARKVVAETEAAQALPEGARRGVSLDEFFSRLQEGESKTLNLVIKADVQGSLEPIKSSLNKLNDEEVEVEILHANTGSITENDIMLAAASDAVVLGFNVEAGPAARAAASNENVQVQTYTVIYHLIEDVEKALKGMLDPVYEDVVIGRAEVRQIFRIRGVGVVAGSYMRTGIARRSASARVIRNASLLFAGPISSLKHLAENVREVRAGFEFGVSIRGWDDIQPGDLLEFYQSKAMER